MPTACTKCGRTDVRFDRDRGHVRTVCTDCRAAQQRVARARSRARVETLDGRAPTATGAPPASAIAADPASPAATAPSPWHDDALAARRHAAENARLRQRIEAALRELATAKAQVSIVEAVRDGWEPLPVERRERASGMREGMPILLCSDWHVEEPVEPEKVNGLNEYSLEIADARVQKLAEGFVWMIEMLEDRFRMRDAVLWLGGDLMTGHIHEDLAETSALAPVETLIWLKQRIVRMIDYVLSETDVERLIVPCSFGNHGRTTPKTRILTGAEHSYEWLLYQLLAEHYAKEERVEVFASKSALQYIQAYGRTIMFTHGDQLNYGGGVGGLTIPLAKAVNSWNSARQADVTCVGHWHQYMPGNRAVVNGSLIGYSPYSIRIRASYEPPQQGFFVLDSRHGPCLHTPIWVD